MGALGFAIDDDSRMWVADVCLGDLSDTLDAGSSTSLPFSCYQRRSFLGNPESRDESVNILGEVRDPFGFRLASYGLMPERVHRLIEETPAALQARVVQVLKQRYRALCEAVPRNRATATTAAGSPGSVGEP